MTFIDDDAPRHIDFIDNPLASAQSRRAARLDSCRTTPHGLNDRIFIPKERRPSATTPHEMTSWQ